MITADDLKAVSIFACLAEAKRAELAKHAAELSYKAGEWSICEGEAPWSFVLLEGCVHVEKEYGASVARGDSFVPGDFYGETPLILNSDTLVSLRADEPSWIMRLDRLQFLDLIESSPMCGDLIFKVMITLRTISNMHLSNSVVLVQ